MEEIKSKYQSATQLKKVSQQLTSVGATCPETSRTSDLLQVKEDQ